MSNNKLKPSPDKIEVIVMRSRQQHNKLKCDLAINILGSPLFSVKSVRNLGVWFNVWFLFGAVVVPMLRRIVLAALLRCMISDTSGSNS